MGIVIYIYILGGAMLNKSLISIVLLCLIGFFQNCSQVNFEAIQKQSTLNNNNIIIDDSPVIAEEPNRNPADLATPLTFTAVNYCSDLYSSRLGANLAVSRQVSVIVSSERDGAGEVFCKEESTSINRENIINGKIEITNCSLNEGQYYVSVLTEDNKNLTTASSAKLVVGEDKEVITKKSINIVVDSNPKETSYDKTAPLYMGSNCERTASPLYVDLRENKDQVGILSSPEKGVQFDIEGANGLPAYTKTQISWFKKGKFAMLALPDENGEINNIDQLFGNNTVGPDGLFSDNGFDALAKFDKNKDGKIDKEDKVYSKLRLWLDKNRNGMAEPWELVRLKSKKLVSIDLVYDPNFYIKDKHGNEIKYMSVVKFEDDTMKPIFDVWFKLGATN